MRRLRFILFVFVALFAAAIPSRAADKGEKRDAAKLFDPTALRTLHIRVSANGWKLMQPTRPSVLGQLFGGGRPPATQPTTKPRYVEGERLEPNPFGTQFAYVRSTVE